MQTLVLSHAKDFARNERGTVAILFGLMAMALMLVIGVAVDQSRAYHAKSEIAAAADAAALAAGRALIEGVKTDAEIAALGEAFFNENMSSTGNFADVAGVRVIPNRANSTIEVQVDAAVPTTIMRLAGFESVNTPADTFSTFQSSDLELGMALDLTGSMCDDPPRMDEAPCASGRKLDALKAAARDLVNTLIPDRPMPNKVRIGLAPYAAAVQLGPYARGASGATSVDGCVRERTGRSAYTDDPIGPGATYNGDTRRRTDIDPTEDRAPYSCPDAAVTPLTGNKATLIAAINGYQAKAATAGHLGAQWAWNIVSPNFKTLWPASSEPVEYDDPKTTKAVILMTDGIFNTAYANGRSGDQALSICSGLGARGVQVHTVAFDSPEPARRLLETCAERAGGTFHEAEDEEALLLAFQSIAKSLNDLRLTQ